MMYHESPLHAYNDLLTSLGGVDFLLLTPSDSQITFPSLL